MVLCRHLAARMTWPGLWPAALHTPCRPGSQPQGSRSQVRPRSSCNPRKGCLRPCPGPATCLGAQLADGAVGGGWGLREGTASGSALPAPFPSSPCLHQLPQAPADCSHALSHPVTPSLVSSRHTASVHVHLMRKGLHHRSAQGLPTAKQSSPASGLCSMAPPPPGKGGPFRPAAIGNTLLPPLYLGNFLILQNPAEVSPQVVSPRQGGASTPAATSQTMNREVLRLLICLMSLD